MHSSANGSGFGTLTERISEWEHRDPSRQALRLRRRDGPGDWLTYRDLIGRGSQYANLMLESGVAPGQVVVLILDDPGETVHAFVGAMLAGAVPSVFAHPSVKIERALYEDTLRKLLAACRTRFVVTHLAELRGLQGITVLDWRDSLRQPVTCRPHSPLPADTALLQHSSGTTGLKKGVALSHASVLEQLESYSRAIGLGETDRIASWLPLYHDMGLIACLLLPLTMGVPLVLMSPFDWLARPRLLFEAITHERCTLCWLPNFAYSFLAQRVGPQDGEGLDLGSMRAFINCSEPISSRSHDVFLKAFADLGVRRDHLATCYAMAETTFAVTQGGIRDPVRSLEVDWEVFARSHRVAPPGPRTTSRRTLVSSGRPIPGASLRVVDEGRVPVPDGRVGEVAISSQSLMTGYDNAPEMTAEVLADGWYFSGDLGFLDDGHLYVTGRRKDLIIIAGNNLYPQDVEEVVSEVEGVYPGRVVCFGVWDEATGTERLVVTAETLIEEARDRSRLKLAIARAVRQRLDCTADDIVLAPHMSLLKSSSGKISRSANRDRYLGHRAGGAAAAASGG